MLIIYNTSVIVLVHDLTDSYLIIKDWFLLNLLLFWNAIQLLVFWHLNKMLKACFAKEKKSLHVYLDHCLSPLTLLHLKICCCPSLNAVILFTVPFDKEFMLPISVTNTCVCWRNEKKQTNPVLFTSRKFIQCLPAGQLCHFSVSMTTEF